MRYFDTTPLGSLVQRFSSDLDQGKAEAPSPLLPSHPPFLTTFAPSSGSILTHRPPPSPPLLPSLPLCSGPAAPWHPRHVYHLCIPAGGDIGRHPRRHAEICLCPLSCFVGAFRLRSPPPSLPPSLPPSAPQPLTPPPSFSILSQIYLSAMNYFRAVTRELKRLDSLSRSPIYSHFSETLVGKGRRAVGKEEGGRGDKDSRRYSDVISVQGGRERGWEWRRGSC